MLLVQLGPQCNNSCIFCAQAEERRSCDNLDIAKLHSFLEQANITELSVAIVGGEPTIHSELPELIRHIKTLGARKVIVQTNARRLAYQNYARTLVDCGVDSFEVSLQGCTAPMHEYHTRSPGSFQQTLRGILNAADLNIPVAVSTILTRSNFRHLTEIVQLIHRIKVLRLIARRVRPMGSALEYRSRIVPPFELVIPYLREAKRTAMSLGLTLEIEGVQESPNSPNPKHQHCIPFFSENTTVNSDHQSSPILLASGRPKPASSENRSNDRRSGQALQEIFPELFDPIGTED